MNGDTGTTFGALVRRHRKELNLTQAELAERANLSLRAVEQIEQEKVRWPYKNTVEKVLEALAVPPELAAAFKRAIPPRPPRHGRELRRRRSDGPARSVLPLQPTSFVPRTRALDAVRARLRDPSVRLLTLTGPGGIGKTRLALAAAQGVLQSFADGAVFVSLADLTRADQVPSTIARGLGVPEAPGPDQQPMERVKRRLRNRRQLLILDNFEHVHGAANVVADLLGACAGLTVLATSRRLLHSQWEQVYEVPALTLPDLERLPGLKALRRNEAVRLFTARAKAVRPGFRLTEGEASAVAEICNMLDGLPLAIELAAARARTDSPRVLLEKLKNRLNTLVDGPTDRPRRQQTMRATIAWSYEQLGAKERRMFRRLWVFAGGFTLAAAQTVCTADGWPEADVGRGLEALTANSLLLITHAEGPTLEVRYRMLETFREFAQERMKDAAEAEVLKRRHAAWFLGFAERAEPRLRHQDLEAFDLVERELGNLRLAYDWFINRTDGVQEALGLAGNLMWFWYLRNRWKEGRDWADAALKRPGAEAPTPQRGEALYGAGGLAWVQADFPAARAHLLESHDLWQDLGGKRQQGWTLALLGLLGLTTAVDHERDEAIRHLMASVSLLEEVDDEWGAGFAKDNLGDVCLARGDYEAAKRWYGESLAAVTRFGAKTPLPKVYNDLARIARAEGDHTAALRLAAKSLVLAEGLRITRFVAMAHHTLGCVKVCEGKLDDARADFALGLAHFDHLGDRVGQQECLDGLAAVAARGGDSQRGSRLIGAAEALREQIGVGVARIDLSLHESTIDLLRRQLGEEAFATERNEGRALHTEQVIAYALGRQSDVGSVRQGVEKQWGCRSPTAALGLGPPRSPAWRAGA